MPESLRKKVDALKLNSDSVNEPLGALPRLKKSASEVTVSANALGHVIGQARKELQEEFRRQLDAAESQWRTGVSQDFRRQLDAAQNEWKMAMEAERASNAEQVQALRQALNDMASAAAATRADLQRLQAASAPRGAAPAPAELPAEPQQAWRPQVGCIAEAKFGREVLECTILEVNESIVKVRWAFDGSEDEVVRSKVSEKAPRRAGQGVLVQANPSPVRSVMQSPVQAPAQPKEVPADTLTRCISGVVTPMAFFMPAFQHPGAPPAAGGSLPPQPVATAGHPHMSPRVAACPAPAPPLAPTGQPRAPLGGVLSGISVPSLAISSDARALSPTLRMTTSPPRLRAVPSATALHQQAASSWAPPGRHCQASGSFAASCASPGAAGAQAAPA